VTRPFKERGFTLARADHSTRVLVTAFLLCVIIGTGVAIAQYAGRAGGLGPRHAVEWIHGNETDFDATVLRVAKSRAELLAFTHDHVFSLAMLLFVVLHLVQLTPHRSRTKIGLTVLGFGGLLGTLGAPWLIGPGDDSLRPPLLIASGSAVLLSLLLGSLATLHEMWSAPLWRRRRRIPEPPPPDPMFPGSERP